MIDTWWLLILLPAAAASGWMAARGRPQEPAGKRYDLPSAYFKGLNYLLNEQPDKAIEVFVKVLEVDTETVETHLAVGNLFRRRGEVERATRIHQNLIARPSLEPLQRSQALFELAQDYLKAGLFDRAENLLLELAEVNLHSEPALKGLVQIYEQEREWEKAAATLRRLVRVTGERQDRIIAHYDCELAEEAERAGRVDEALALTRRAIGADSHCVRATILRARIEGGRGGHRAALELLRQVGDQDPDFVGEAVAPISNSYRALGDEDGLYEFLSRGLERYGAVELMLALADLTKERDGPRAAQQFVVQWLRQNPSVHGLNRLIELNLAAASGQAREDLTILQTMVGQWLEHQQGYVCGQCGFEGRQLHWQCPGCRSWSTVRPLSRQHAN